MRCSLEADLEARSAALEESIVAAAGLGGKSGAPTVDSHHAAFAAAGGEAVAAAAATGAEGEDLAMLLGVGTASPSHAKGEKTATAAASLATGTAGTALSGATNNINIQMIHILQTQRDSYKERLTRVSSPKRALFHIFILFMMVIFWLVRRRLI